MAKYKLLTGVGYDSYDKHGIYDTEKDGDIKLLVEDDPEDWELVEDTKTTKADRYNEGKPQFSLLDLNSMEPGVRVLAFGAKKYARNNWKKGLVFSEILDSMMRHIAELQEGNWLDEDSGLPHIGHLQCNSLFLGGKENIMDIKFKDNE